MKQVNPRLLQNSVDSIIVKDVKDVLEAAFLAKTFEESLQLISEHVRSLIKAHQSAVSYLPDANFNSAIHAVSLSEKYEKYRSYDVMPTGEGLWTCVREEGLALRLTEKEVYSHPKFKNFSGLKDVRGLEHPPLPGWLAAPVMKDGSYLGLIQLGDKIDGEFTKEDESSLLDITKLIYPIFAMHQYHSKLNAINAELKRSKEEYADLYNNAPDMFVSIDLKTTKVIQCNETIINNLGYNRSEIVGMPVFFLYHPNSIDKAKRIFQSIFSSNLISNEELQLKRKDGSIIDVVMNASTLKNEDGEMMVARSVFRDVSERKRAEEALKNQEDALEDLVEARTSELNRVNKLLLSEIEKRNKVQDKLLYLTKHDTATGLYNASMCHEFLNKLISFAERNKTFVGVVYVDVDAFKRINDSMGHPAGDELLKQLGKRIKQALRKSDIACRVGGDEFIIILDNVKILETIGNLAKKLIDIISLIPFDIKGKKIELTVSIGISSFPSDGKTVGELIKKADMAMYTAKKSGKNKYQYFSKMKGDNEA